MELEIKAIDGCPEDELRRVHRAAHPPRAALGRGAAPPDGAPSRPTSSPSCSTASTSSSTSAGGSSTRPAAPTVPIAVGAARSSSCASATSARSTTLIARDRRARRPRGRRSCSPPTTASARPARSSTSTPGSSSRATCSGPTEDAARAGRHRRRLRGDDPPRQRARLDDARSPTRPPRPARGSTSWTAFRAATSRCPSRCASSSRVEIAQALREVRRPHDGQPLVEEVWTRRQAFSGPYRTARPRSLAGAGRRRARCRSCPRETIVRPPRGAARPPSLGGHLRSRTGPAIRAGRERRGGLDRRRRAAAAAPARRAGARATCPAACPTGCSRRASWSAGRCAARRPRIPLQRGPAVDGRARARGAGGGDGATARPGVRGVSGEGGELMPKATLTSGLRLHYQQVGEGPDLVMVHGLTGNLAVWHLRIVPELADRYRVLTYDLRGHGHSDVPADRLHAPTTMAGGPARAARRARDRAPGGRRAQLRRRHRALLRAQRTPTACAR